MASKKVPGVGTPEPSTTPAAEQEEADLPDNAPKITHTVLTPARVHTLKKPS